MLLSIEAMDSEQIKSKAIMEVKQSTDLQDPRMGNINGRCETCGSMPKQCLGHYGYIDLHDFYVFNPLLYSEAKTLLQSVCLNCLHIGTIEKGRQKCMNC